MIAPTIQLGSFNDLCWKANTTTKWDTRESIMPVNGGEGVQVGTYGEGEENRALDEEKESSERKYNTET